MIDLQALRILIDSDPVNDPPATDAQVLTWLEVLVTAQRDITYTDLVMWSAAETTAFKLEEALSLERTARWAVGGTGTPIMANGVYNDAIALEALLLSGADLALSRDDVRDLINRLSGGGKPFSVPNKQALLDLSDEQVPRWRTSTGSIDWVGGAGDQARMLADIAVARAL